MVQSIQTAFHERLVHQLTMWTETPLSFRSAGCPGQTRLSKHKCTSPCSPRSPNNTACTQDSTPMQALLHPPTPCLNPSNHTDVPEKREDLLNRPAPLSNMRKLKTSMKHKWVSAHCSLTKSRSSGSHYRGILGQRVGRHE